MEVEKYQPSPEELKNAEDMMTPSEKELTDKRDSKEPLRQRHRELNPEVSQSGSITVHDQGHEIFLRNDGCGKIDGIDIGWGDDTEGSELVRQLYTKYGGEIAQTEEGFKGDAELEEKARNERDAKDAEYRIEVRREVRRKKAYLKAEQRKQAIIAARELLTSSKNTG